MFCSSNVGIRIEFEESEGALMFAAGTFPDGMLAAPICLDNEFEFAK